MITNQVPRLERVWTKMVEAYGPRAYRTIARNNFKGRKLRRPLTTDSVAARFAKFACVILTSLGWNWQLIDEFFEWYVSERSIEVPFAIHELRKLPRGAQILEFGPGVSTLSYDLAKEGYLVTAVDLREYPYRHDRLRFLKGNFLEIDLPVETFDAVAAISTIEHVGLRAFSGSLRKSGDVEVIEKVWKILKTGGKLLLTVPYGQWAQTPWYRVYDDSGLSALLADFELERDTYFFKCAPTKWIEVTKTDLSKVDSSANGETNGVVLVVAMKIKPSRTSSQTICVPEGVADDVEKVSMAAMHRPGELPRTFRFGNDVAQSKAELSQTSP